MKKIIMSITVILLVSITGLFFYMNGSKNELKVETKNQDTNEKLVSNENKESNKPEKIEPESKIDFPEEKKDEEIKPVDKPTEKVDNTTSSKEVKEVKQSNPTQKQEVKREEQKKPVPIVESKKQEIWESLGMTKDQYYNQPMYSWERVDFKNRAECEAHGDSYEPYLNGEVLYNCRDVTSPSGKYLGVMFDVEKLN